MKSMLILAVLTLLSLACSDLFMDYLYQPDHQYLKTEKNKHVTIEHLLTGTSGLPFENFSARYLFEPLGIDSGRIRRSCQQS